MKRQALFVLFTVVLLTGFFAELEAQQLPMDPLTTWRYVGWEKEDLTTMIVREQVFVVLSKDVSSEDVVAFIEYYRLDDSVDGPEDITGLTADHPEVHRRLFVEESNSFEGRGLVFTFLDSPSSSTELLIRIATMADEEIVRFVSPVFSSDEGLFALTPYAVVTWSALLDRTNLPTVVKRHGLTLARVPLSNESSALVQLLPENKNILAAMVKVQEDHFFNSATDVTYPVVVRFAPPLDMEWQVMPASVEESTGAPRTLIGYPLEFRIWATLADGVSLARSQFRADGKFMQSFNIGTVVDGQTIKPLPKLVMGEEDGRQVMSMTMGPGVSVPLLVVDSAIVTQVNNEDGTTSVEIVIPFRVRQTEELWIDALSLLVRAVHPLTGQESEFSYERYYDQPITLVGLLDPDAQDGGDVSPFVLADALPSEIIGDLWPRLLLGAGIFLLLSVGVVIVWPMFVSLFRNYDEVESVDPYEHRSSELDDILNEITSVCEEDLETVVRVVTRLFLPFVGKELLGDESSLLVGAINWHTSLEKAKLPSDLEERVSIFIEVATSVASDGGVQNLDFTEIDTVVCDLAEEIRKRWQ